MKSNIGNVLHSRKFIKIWKNAQKTEHTLKNHVNVPKLREDKTMTFSVTEEREVQMKQTLTTVYDALTQKGYNPINQIVGYILSEDPTYITTYNNARNLIRHIDRDELLQVLVKSYLMH